ncbi:hypothetical protein Trydic_g3341 [Trypoxylus dichotomus]
MRTLLLVCGCLEILEVHRYWNLGKGKTGWSGYQSIFQTEVITMQTCTQNSCTTRMTLKGWKSLQAIKFDFEVVLGCHRRRKDTTEETVGTSQRCAEMGIKPFLHQSK